MIVRLKLPMDQAEYSALLKFAVSNLRNPVDQAHYIIRQELIRLGLITAGIEESEMVEKIEDNGVR